MRHRLLVVMTALVLAVLVVACGEEGTTEETGMDEDTVHVADAWARSPSEDVGAVYFVAHNGAEEEDLLIGVSSPDAARAEIHETVEEGGQMVMQPVASVAIGPDEEVSFEPGGYHVMLFDLTAPLEVDSTVTVVLEFELAGQVPIEAIVKEYVPEGMDMGGEGEMGMTGPTGSTAPADMG